ncbi:MAG: universal stress protein [Dehalococcoidia bacterium]|nr:MAG: universal stress protein [Dehalococcoidia bacterium]
MLTNRVQAFTMLRRMDIGKILVPVSGNDVDAEVIRMACDLAEDSSASVRAVYVIEVERSLPLDVSLEQQSTAAEEILGRVQTMARELGYEIDTGMLQAREAGPAIVHEAVEGRADLIVMWVGYRRRLGVFDIGDTISHVLRDAPCHVVLYRAAAAPGDIT